MLFEIKILGHFVSRWYKRALRQEIAADYDSRKINEINCLEISNLTIKGTDPTPRVTVVTFRLMHDLSR